jgi:phage tail-like protein
MTERSDPYRGFRFKLELGGIISGGFSEVSGLSVETEVETRKEGGENNFEYKLPKATKYSNLTLKRGISDDNLWAWYKDVIYGKVERQDISVCLLDEGGTEVMRWNFEKAFPVKWNGPSLNASSNSVAVESLVLVHHGLQKG